MIALVVARTTGGTGRHVRAVAAALDDALVVGPRSSDEAIGFAAVARYEPVEIASGPRPFADLRAIRRLRRLLADADLVHAHGLRAATLASRSLPKDVPFVVTWHNRVSPRWTLLERHVARRATVTLCVSPDLVDRAKALGANDTRLAPVGARRPETARPAADVRESLGGREAPLIVAAGRLAEQKGFALLIEAATHYELRTPRPRTIVAGDGPLRAALAEAAAEAGVDVTFLGERADVPDLLAAADVVAITSTWEGSPLTAHEALFAARPIVATAVGGLPAMLDGVATLVPRDPKAFAAAITHVLDNPAAAASMAAAAGQRSVDWPDEGETVRRVLNLYGEVGRGATPAND